MKNLREIILRILILLAGLTIAHFGVTLFLMAELGSDPFNVLTQGIYRNIVLIPGLTGMSHGLTHMGLCFLIMLVLLIVDRTYVKIGTVICMFAGGPIIDFFSGPLSGLVSSASPLWLRLAVNGLGCVILAIGMSLVIKSEIGTGPNDLVSIVISDKLKKNFGIVRVLTDIAFMGIGFLLGGTIGVGTAICALLVGPTANLFLPKCEKLVKRILPDPVI